MSRLGKKLIAQTFKFDCDRFLRFELANDKERKKIGIEGIALGNIRPAVNLMIEAGNKWEADKYQDLIDCLPKGKVIYELEDKINERIGRKPFKEITNLFEILRKDCPPYVIIESSFIVPDSVSPALKIAFDIYGIELRKARPDIIWIRPFSTGSPLIRTSNTNPDFELHIIDVKMASEASLKHFTEVTFYAFALAEAIKMHGLDMKYQVSAKGLIWPGSHDNNKFKTIFRDFQAKGEPDPVLAALNQTLDAVPYEVYEIHVRKFLDERILGVMAQHPLDTAWHVSNKCQLCQYLKYCSKIAQDEDHLSKIAWLNYGQAELLRKNNIKTTLELSLSIDRDDASWRAVKSENYQLKADQLALAARSKAFQTNQPEIIRERKCGFMPNWVDMSIYLTIHFDPGSGLTFAMGAKRVYFDPKRVKGTPPVINEHTFIVDKVENLNPDTERNRLVEFVDLITGWLLEADAENNRIRNEKHARGERDNDYGKVKAHVFFWSQLEVKQMLRMIERHMTDNRVVDRIELLIRLFPPDSILPPDAESYKSQPGTVVKNVIKQLVGLPLEHDYTLLESANVFFPNIKADGTPFTFNAMYGFWTELNDQIPFERAYELWKDDVFLKHSVEKGGRKYTRDEIYEGLKNTVKIHLNALQHIVMRLREQCGSQLTLKKSGFSAAPPPQLAVPESARKIITFQKLNSIADEIENRHNISLPVDEKESRFISIRGLLPISHQQIIDEIRASDARYRHSFLMAFTFSPSSRDAKIKEGEFLCAISNEDDEVQLDMPWYKQLDLNFYDGQDLMYRSGITEDWYINAKLSTLLQVSVVRLFAAENPPFVILEINENRLFQFAIRQGIIDLSRPMVLDPFFKDFESKEIEKVMRMIGGRVSNGRTR